MEIEVPDTQPQATPILPNTEEDEAMTGTQVPLFAPANDEEEL
jgi:hypothetical protein